MGLFDLPEARLASLEARVAALEGEVVEPPIDALSVRDYGAVGDGYTDSRPAIQACIDAAMAVGKCVYVPEGIYRMVASGGVGLSFPSATAVTGDGAGSVLELYDDGTDDRHVLADIESRHGIAFSDLLLRGTQTGRRASVQAVWASGASDVTFTRVTWDKCEYAIRTTTHSPWASNITVTNCRTLGNVLNPFYLAYCDDFYLDGGTYESNRVDCMPGRYPHHFYIAGYCDGITIKNATFTGGQSQWFHIYGSAHNSNVLCEDIVVEAVYEGAVIYGDNPGPIVFDGLTISTTRMGSSNPEWFRLADGAGNVTVKNFSITGDPSKNDFLCEVRTGCGANCLFQDGSMTSCYTSGSSPAGTFVESGASVPTYDNVTINGTRYDT